MLQALKSRGLIAARLPRRLAAGMQYRLKGWLEASPSTRKIHELFNKGVPHGGEWQQLSFTFAAIALSARVACSAGLTRRKYAVFRECFPLEGELCGTLRSLFALACQSEAPIEQYVSQVKYAFPRNASLAVALLDRLFRIASADGPVAAPAQRLLADI
ncbi:MAG: TerB family tellurite resistance protein, partial [Pseudomonadota bacterium]|nr:TerB family tellurite resistance protein [Pseudomonadota bacterium]